MCVFAGRSVIAYKFGRFVCDRTRSRSPGVIPVAVVECRRSVPLVPVLPARDLGTAEESAAASSSGDAGSSALPAFTALCAIGDRGSGDEGDGEKLRSSALALCAVPVGRKCSTAGPGRLCCAGR